MTWQVLVRLLNSSTHLLTLKAGTRVGTFKMTEPSQAKGALLNVELLAASASQPTVDTLIHFITLYQSQF